MGFKNQLENFTHAKIYFDEPMNKHTALGVGGKALYFAEVDSLCGLNLLVSLAKEHRIKVKILGNGTNVLVSEKGFDGLIISIKRLSDVFFKRDEVRAMAGAPLDKLIRFAHDNGLTGLEALSGIPATVGGAVVMNAGAFGHNISDCLTTVETLVDGKIKVYDKTDCKFGYRTSRFLCKKEIIISACFSLTPEEKQVILSKEKSYKEVRNSIQPMGKSCGSVFKNPKPYTAGELIDRAGLKGFSIGCVTVSKKHGNFITTKPRATANDVYTLIQIVKDKIKSEFNVVLEEEVEFIGDF